MGGDEWFERGYEALKMSEPAGLPAREMICPQQTATAMRRPRRC
jgi:hypothetical protein